MHCEMREDCAKPVAMVDKKGYVYCAAHGMQRRNSGTPCRKLRPAEIVKLNRREPLRY